MQKQLILMVILLAVLLGFSPTAKADPPHNRQQHQAQRIRQGLAGGQITPWEAQLLYQEQRQLRYLKRFFLADGAMTRIEHRILEEHLDRASDHIYRAKHNQRQAGKAASCRPADRFYAR